MLTDSDKYCPACDQHLPDSAFYQRQTSTSTKCKLCETAARQTRNAPNPRGHYSNEREIAAQQIASEPWVQDAACTTAPIGLTEYGAITDGEEPTDRRRAWAYSSVLVGGSNVRRDLLESKLRKVCGSCPVLFDCRRLARVEVFGFLAGTSEAERNGVR